MGVKLVPFATGHIKDLDDDNQALILTIYFGSACGFRIPPPLALLPARPFSSRFVSSLTLVPVSFARPLSSVFCLSMYPFVEWCSSVVPSRGQLVPSVAAFPPSGLDLQLILCIGHLPCPPESSVLSVCIAPWAYPPGLRPLIGLLLFRPLFRPARSLVFFVISFRLAFFTLFFSVASLLAPPPCHQRSCTPNRPCFPCCFFCALRRL